MTSTVPSTRFHTWFHIKVIVLVLIFIQISSTQTVAWYFSYHPHLGAPVVGACYWPWQWFIWAWRWYGTYPRFFDLVYGFTGAATLASFGLYVMILTVWGRRHQPAPDLHGSAHWASKEEIYETGLLAPKVSWWRRLRRRLKGDLPRSQGVYVGGWKDDQDNIHYLRHNGPEHILAFAPTRSGKGVGLVLTTLLSWLHSAVILDIKGENWALTAGWRKAHANNRVLKFDPTATDGSSVKFNPLDEIRLGTDYEVADVQNIVTMIVDPDGKGLNDHWAKTGHALLVGAVLHSLYMAKARGEVATLKGVAELLSDPSREITAVFDEMLETKHKNGKVHEVVAASARDMKNKADNERSGVLSTSMSYLTLYRDKIVADNTACSEFAISDLMNHEQPVSLYIVVPPSDKDRLKPLVRLLINQIVRKLTEKMDFADGSAQAHYKHRLLLMIDEFPSLGKLEIFQEALAFIAGYGLKAYLITQDLSQLYAAYTRDESILSNCHVRIAYAPNKIETAELLSKMTGQSTVLKTSVSTSGKRFGAVLEQVSESHQEVQRPLMTPDECMRLQGPKKDADGQITEAGDMLVFAAGFSPIYGKQILYFKDPVFTERSKIAAPAKSDRLYPQGLSRPEANAAANETEPPPPEPDAAEPAGATTHPVED